MGRSPSPDYRRDRDRRDHNDRDHSRDRHRDADRGQRRFRERTPPRHGDRGPPRHDDRGGDRHYRRSPPRRDDRPRDDRRRSRSPPRRRSRSPPRDGGYRRRSRTPPRRRQDESPPKEAAKPAAQPGIAIEDLPADMEEEQMMAMLGFPVGGFATTKGQHVEGNDAYHARGAVAKNSKREYRQYMNRRGGFNRPLEKSH